MTLKIWMPELVDVELIDMDPHNTNKQSRAVFKELQKNIEEEGMDENVIIVPKENGRYHLAHGNHRYAAAKAAGAKQVMAVVRPDWDTTKAAIQSVRRNIVRGDQDEAAFTALVNKLQQEDDMNIETIQAEMGFTDPNEFADLYREEKKQEAEVARIANEEAPAMRVLDDLTDFVNHLIVEHGDDLAYSFMCIPVSGKHHVLVSSTNALKQVIEKIVNRCRETNLDINTALTGLLHLGINQSNFIQQNITKEMDELEKELTNDLEDFDLEV